MIWSKGMPFRKISLMIFKINICILLEFTSLIYAAYWSLH